jgi:hypothetical protein
VATGRCEGRRWRHNLCVDDYDLMSEIESEIVLDTQA